METGTSTCLHRDVMMLCSLPLTVDISLLLQNIFSDAKCAAVLLDKNHYINFKLITFFSPKLLFKRFTTLAVSKLVHLFWIPIAVTVPSHIPLDTFSQKSPRWYRNNCVWEQYIQMTCHSAHTIKSQISAECPLMKLQCFQYPR